MEDLQVALKEVFGYERFRENQYPIVDAILKNKSILALMPTGGGKSLCYQLPALLKKGTAIVVSPLVALMKNQVDALHQREIRAAFLNSTLRKKEVEAIKKELLSGEIRLLYIAPETLNKEETLAFFSQLSLSFLAVDEAHCISEWGDDFRPEYGKIHESLVRLGNIPVAAFTATATPRVKNDILKKLNIPKEATFVASFERKNLKYRITGKKDSERKMVHWIKKNPRSAGIIYCHSRKKVEEIASFLRVNDIAAHPYHAGIDYRKRVQYQEDFLSDRVDVMVATIAFGMGIDKANVRFVFHHDPPKSLENYYQETGRAGRDGAPSECIFYYDKADVERLKKLNKNKSVADRMHANTLLTHVQDFAESPLCLMQQILYYFGEIAEKPCGQCTHCIAPSPTYGEEKRVFSILNAILKEKNEPMTRHTLAQRLSGDDSEESAPTTWQHIIHQLLFKGYLSEDMMSGVLKPTPLGVKFLKDPFPIELKKIYSYEEKDKKEGGQSLLQKKLLQSLFNLREEEAKKKGLKPYIIFKENMLRRMSMQYPCTLEALTHIPGISLSKAKKFGLPFVHLIEKFTKKHAISMSQEAVIKRKSAKFSKRIQLIKQIDKKIDLKELASLHLLSFSELIEALEEICDAGVRLNITYYLDQTLEKENKEDLYDYFFSQEDDNIERACQELADYYTEEEVRLSRIQFLSEVAN